MNVGECIILNNMNSSKDLSSKKSKPGKPIEELPPQVISNNISQKVIKVRIII